MSESLKPSRQAGVIALVGAGIGIGVSVLLNTAYSYPELTPRGREILELIAQGLTNSAIAERFVISPKTVRNQVYNILGKLQVRTGRRRLSRHAKPGWERLRGDRTDPGRDRYSIRKASKFWGIMAATWLPG